MYKEKIDSHITFDKFTEYFPVKDWLYSQIQKYAIKDELFLVDQINRDIQWIAYNDPAAKNNNDYVDNSYTGALALACYRLTNYLSLQLDLVNEAKAIAQEIYALTSIYVHPEADIGCPISIDHGYETIIGENCEIGDRCIILNGVKLLSSETENRSIALKTQKIKIGDDVVICANTEIHGNHFIKDNAFIKPFTYLKNSDNEVRTA
jgi:serine O-acetyltransferase